MSDRDLMTLDLCHLPHTAVAEAKHLLSERDETQEVLRNMLSQLEECSSQAASLELLYAGLGDATAGYKGPVLQQLPAVQDETSAAELAGLQALVQQKRQQLHQLHLSSQDHARLEELKLTRSPGTSAKSDVDMIAAHRPAASSGVQQPYLPAKSQLARNVVVPPRRSPPASVDQQEISMLQNQCLLLRQLLHDDRVQSARHRKKAAVIIKGLKQQLQQQRHHHATRHVHEEAEQQLGALMGQLSQAEAALQAASARIASLQGEAEAATEQAYMADARLHQTKLQLQAAESRADAAERAMQEQSETTAGRDSPSRNLLETLVKEQQFSLCRLASENRDLQACLEQIQHLKLPLLKPSQPGQSRPETGLEAASPAGAGAAAPRSASLLLDRLFAQCESSERSFQPVSTDNTPPFPGTGAPLLEVAHAHPSLQHLCSEHASMLGNTPLQSLEDAHKSAENALPEVSMAGSSNSEPYHSNSKTANHLQLPQRSSSDHQDRPRLPPTAQPRSEPKSIYQLEALQAFKIRQNAHEQALESGPTLTMRPVSQPNGGDEVASHAATLQHLLQDDTQTETSCSSPDVFDPKLEVASLPDRHAAEADEARQTSGAPSSPEPGNISHDFRPMIPASAPGHEHALPSVMEAAQGSAEDSLQPKDRPGHPQTIAAPPSVRSQLAKASLESPTVRQMGIQPLDGRTPLAVSASMADDAAVPSEMRLKARGKPLDPTPSLDTGLTGLNDNGMSAAQSAEDKMPMQELVAVPDRPKRPSTQEPYIAVPCPDPAGPRVPSETPSLIEIPSSPHLVRPDDRSAWAKQKPAASTHAGEAALSAVAAAAVDHTAAQKLQGVLLDLNPHPGSPSKPASPPSRMQRLSARTALLLDQLGLPREVLPEPASPRKPRALLLDRLNDGLHPRQATAPAMSSFMRYALGQQPHKQHQQQQSSSLQDQSNPDNASGPGSEVHLMSEAPAVLHMSASQPLRPSKTLSESLAIPSGPPVRLTESPAAKHEALVQDAGLHSGQCTSPPPADNSAGPSADYGAVHDPIPSSFHTGPDSDPAGGARRTDAQPGHADPRLHAQPAPSGPSQQAMPDNSTAQQRLCSADYRHVPQQQSECRLLKAVSNRKDAKLAVRAGVSSTKAGRSRPTARQLARGVRDSKHGRLQAQQRAADLEHRNQALAQKCKRQSARQQALRTALMQHQHSLAEQQQVIELVAEPTTERMSQTTRRRALKGCSQQPCEPAWAQHLQTALQIFQQKHPQACLPDMYICARADS
ncbi:hypothetical protein WJX74_007897 [Apatococcus lobatus]|uniref:Uncharacterized protein n=1 Tax=Apatococcus lobatus TaxID=904363 RepID=A0AAW1S790_9CHLO